MKLFKIAAASICAVLVMASAGCAGKSAGSASAKTPAPSEVTTKIMSDVKFPEMIEVSRDRLSKYYTVEDSAVKEMSVFVCSSSASSAEVAVFEAAKDSDVDAIKAAVQTRIDDKKDVFENYGAPEEFDHIKNCVFETKGNYVILIVSPDNKTAKSTMESFF